MSAPIFKYHDGGRAASGFKGRAGDCVCRAISIATNGQYLDIYNRLARENAKQRPSKHSVRDKKSAGIETADHGIWTTRQWFKKYMAELGLIWVPTMQVGQGCKVHLHPDELPSGRLIVAVSKHYTTMIDGVIYDTFDPSRKGTRCVYGFWIAR